MTSSTSSPVIPQTQAFDATVSPVSKTTSKTLKTSKTLPKESSSTATQKIATVVAPNGATLHHPADALTQLESAALHIQTSGGRVNTPLCANCKVDPNVVSGRPGAEEASISLQADRPKRGAQPAKVTAHLYSVRHFKHKVQNLLPGLAEQIGMRQRKIGPGSSDKNSWELCVSLKGYYGGACSACVLYGKGKNCEFYSEFRSLCLLLFGTGLIVC
jgi:hypothetical protein